MLPTPSSAAQDFHKYQGALRFPPALEREFMRDFGERQPPMLQRFFALGLAMCDYFRMRTFAGQKLDLRVGISSGPVVAAVIGLQRFRYDVWGDTVNTAFRMCSHGVSGVVQITEETYRLICDKFHCVPGGLIDVKGKGSMNVWHVLNVR